MKVRDAFNTHILPFTVADPKNPYGDGGLTDGVVLDGSPTAGSVTVPSNLHPRKDRGNDDVTLTDILRGWIWLATAFGYYDISVISIKFSSCWLFNDVTNFIFIISKLKWFQF
jgi:hypothetical protein